MDAVVAACRALGKIGPRAERSIPILLEMANDRDHISSIRNRTLSTKVQRAALSRLLFFKSEYKDPSSHDRFDDPNRDVRAFSLKIKVDPEIRTGS